ncbi:MAG TPA: FUSC family membrane protein [Parasegetibacter sp.]
MLPVPADYIREYRSFINSHYLSEGVRITVGVTLPAIIFSYFDLLSIGLIVSLGALCVSLTDNAGPIHHRRNGMAASSALIFLVTLITAFAVSHTVLLGIWVMVCCFVFSFIAVFGARAASVGTASLIALVLNIDETQAIGNIFLNAVYVLCGGLWYMALSLALYELRPYKLTQQALGECINATADYLKIKASFYEANVDFNKSYAKQIEQQVHVHTKQDLVRELLFKTRDLLRDSTTTSRTLLMIFLDIVDLFERVITSHQDYAALHRYFDKYEKTHILEEYRKLILLLASELEEISISVKSGKPSLSDGELERSLIRVKEVFNQFRDEHRDASNIEGFISLRHILNSIEDIAARIRTLHQYTTYNKKLSEAVPANLDYEKFVSSSNIDIKLLRDNLSFNSNIFRHALRVSIGTTLAYILIQFLNTGHSYWVLMTTIVLIKPAYSLTKKRNYERLAGTVVGAILGLGLIYFIKDKTALLVLMIFFMIGTYSLMRVRYLMSVVLMTPYVLLLFYLLRSGDIEGVLMDRLVDTGIGSAIALMANYFLLPAWEQRNITSVMKSALEDNIKYFQDIGGIFAGRPCTTSQFKLSRKKAFVSLANLSDAFNRMLSEPKHKQEGIKYIHQYVVSNHMLTSHIATLSYYVPLAGKYREDASIFAQILATAEGRFRETLEILTRKLPDEQQSDENEPIKLLNEKVSAMVTRRKTELETGIVDSQLRYTLSEYKSIADQFNFINNISIDLRKIAKSLSPSLPVHPS